MSPPPWKAWYSTRRWRELKERVHVRDALMCQLPDCGRLCGGTFPADDSPVADHREAHRGRAAVFWDEANVQTLCKACHDKAKQAEEQESLHVRGEWY